MPEPPNLKHKSCDRCRRAKTRCHEILPASADSDVAPVDASGSRLCQRCKRLGVECLWESVWKKRGPVPLRLRESSSKSSPSSSQPAASTSRSARGRQDDGAPSASTSLEPLTSPRGTQSHLQQPSTQHASWLLDLATDDEQPEPSSYRLHPPTLPPVESASHVASSTNVFLPSQEFVFRNGNNESPSSAGTGASPSSHGPPRNQEHLSLDVNGVARIHSAATGLDLVVPAHRVWRWPHPEPRETQPALANAFMSPSWPKKHARLEVDLPESVVIYEILLLFWAYVHPIFPGVDKETFMRELHEATMLRRDHAAAVASGGTDPSPWDDFVVSTSGRTFLVLVFAILSVAVSYRAATEASQSIENRQESDRFFTSAMELLKVDPWSRASDAHAKLVACQALLLLSYREYSYGLVCSSYNMLSQAIGLGRDILLFRDLEKWGVPIPSLTHEDFETRKRVWYSLVLFDNLISCLRGFPSLRPNDYDCRLPSTDEPDEYLQWRPVILAPTATSLPRGSTGSSPPSTKSFTLSTFNALSELVQLRARVLNELQLSFPSNEAVIIGRHEQLVAELQKWEQNLLPHLRIRPLEQEDTFTPHLVALHMAAHDTSIILWRTCLRRPGTEAPDNEYERQRQAQALRICSTAARQITSITRLYGAKFGMQTASSFLIFWTFNSALMHMYNSSMETHDDSRALFQESIGVLHGLETIWPGAAGARKVLTSIATLRNGPSGTTTPHNMELANSTLLPEQNNPVVGNALNSVSWNAVLGLDALLMPSASGYAAWDLAGEGIGAGMGLDDDGAWSNLFGL